MTVRATAKQSEIARAVKAAQSCGLVVCGIEQTRDGFRVLTGAQAPPPLTDKPKARDPAEMARERRRPCESPRT